MNEFPRQRLLTAAGSGISTHFHHLLDDFKKILPHTKKENKIEKRDRYKTIKELSELYRVNCTLLFESRKRMDDYLWVSKTNGPSVKFQIHDIVTLRDIRLTGNCLKGSRAVLSFDANFDSSPHWQVIKGLFIQAFGIPERQANVKPFIDHILSFHIVDGFIYMRNFQMTEPDGPSKQSELIEIGPRCRMEPIKILAQSFSGETLWKNGSYVTPNTIRQEERKSMKDLYVNKKVQVLKRKKHLEENPAPVDEISQIFK
eukprot:TRINITY_DN2096_c0_g1_i1.p1 TRINITY_DN2096_c0_g1~~TRINITY_DN2096_c0_g1_i1.p1  ORF type:complete len:271 (-),score=67.96 TRINITY_DN2096_c0_g1_i1:7-780(-)